MTFEVDERDFYVSWIYCVWDETSNYICLNCSLKKWTWNSGEKDMLGGCHRPTDGS